MKGEFYGALANSEVWGVKRPIDRQMRNNRSTWSAIESYNGGIETLLFSAADRTLGNS
jgi:hypothetical protein